MRRVSNGPPVGSVNAVLLRLYAVAWTLPGTAQQGRNTQEGDSSITDTYDTSANEVLTAPLSCLEKTKQQQHVQVNPPQHSLPGEGVSVCVCVHC